VGLSATGLLSGPLGARGWTARTFTISGTVTAALAFVLLAATTGPDTSLWLIRGELLLIGAGFGQLLGQLILLVQDSAPRPQLGVATTSVRYFQALGNALGTALFGTVLTRLYAADGPGGDVSALARLTGDAHTKGVHAYVDATSVVFWSGAALMAVAALMALRLPKSRPGAAASEPAKQPVAA
jgi:hypothetical protein